jgi:hypothetical protein
MSTYTVVLTEDEETGDAILPLPEELLSETGWKEGTLLDFVDNGDGSFSLKEVKE